MPKTTFHSGSVESPRASPQARARMVRAVVLPAAMALLGYAVGRIHADSHAPAAQEHGQRAMQVDQKAQEGLVASEAALLQARAEAKQARRERALLIRVTTLYEASRRAQQALDALNLRDTQTAESQLRAAVQLLVPLSDKVEGVRPLLTRLSGTKLLVAGSPNEQRRVLVPVIERLDALIAAQTASTGLPTRDVPAATQ